jgi:hypothetical protein
VRRSAPLAESPREHHDGIYRQRPTSREKALAIAVLAIERQPGPFQSASDQADIKALLDKLIESDTELEHYARSARIAVTGEPN